jgi:hypothetical protein
VSRPLREGRPGHSALSRSLGIGALRHRRYAEAWALTPRPEINPVLYHGVLAPHARWRRRVVAYGRVTPDPTSTTGSTAALAPVPDGVGKEPPPARLELGGPHAPGVCH